MLVTVLCARNRSKYVDGYELRRVGRREERWMEMIFYHGFSLPTLFTVVPCSVEVVGRMPAVLLQSP